MSLAIPDSTILLTLTAVGFSLLSNALTRWRVDLATERRVKAEIAEWTNALKAAMKAGDKQQEEKLRKKEQSINQMRLKISSARTKVALYTIVPFFAIYYLVLSFVGADPVAFVPGSVYIPYIMELTLPAGAPVPAFCAANACAYVTSFGWYLISSFAFSGVIMRLLKTQT